MLCALFCPCHNWGCGLAASCQWLLAMWYFYSDVFLYMTAVNTNKCYSCLILCLLPLSHYPLHQHLWPVNDLICYTLPLHPNPLTQLTSYPMPFLQLPHLACKPSASPDTPVPHSLQAQPIRAGQILLPWSQADSLWLGASGCLMQVAVWSKSKGRSLTAGQSSALTPPTQAVIIYRDIKCLMHFAATMPGGLKPFHPAALWLMASISLYWLMQWWR